MPKITALPPATQANDADLLVIDQQNVTKNLSYNLLTYNSGGASRLLSSKLGDIVSVKDPPFLAKGDGVTDDTAAIQAAINFTKTFLSSQTERGLVWPAGAYNVTSLDFTGANRIDNIALGGVIIFGTSGAGTSILHADGASGVTPATHLNFIGNFSVQMSGGSAYQNGVKWNTVTNSYQHLDISGSYSNAAMDVAFSFDNEFWITPSNTNTGNPVYGIKCSDGATNRNKWFVRGLANGGNGVVMFVQGLANEISGDFNNALFGIQLNAALGTTLISPYFESLGTNGACIQFLNNPIGTVISAGEYEIPTGGSAFDLSSSQNTVILAPRIKGISGGNTRTAFKLGAAAFGLTVVNPDMQAAAPQAVDTVFTGAWRGGTGGLTTFNSYGPLFFDGSGDVFFGGTATGPGVVTYTNAGGLQAGAPTGADKGSGTINVAGGVYLNNSLLLGAKDTSISTGVGSIKMKSANPATNAAWVPITAADGTVYFVPGWTTNNP